MRGKMTHPADFRLYHGNALDVLAEMLADELRAPADPGDILAPDTILIPQVAMRRWLQATLARKHGIAANLEFLTPGEFVARALDANLGASTNDLDAAGLRWRLYAALTDAGLLARPGLATIAAYLGDGDPLKPWALAGELAGVFEKYQAWRRDWLLRWEAGADRDDAQAVLWRMIAGGQPHRARRLQAYIARFVEGDARPAGLPSRLFAFGTLNVSPDVLRVMASQARVGTLHFYLPTPTREFWGDLQSLGARVRAGGDPFASDGGNPLLRDWGAAGKDFMALLGSYEVVHPSGDIAAYADPLEGGMKAASLLRRMQADLLHDRDGAAGEKRTTVDRGDPSLQFHACHTRLRELQVLHDRLRALLEDGRFDPPLQPREIAVLAPDIDPYLPYLDAVFGGQGDPGLAIPYAKADASLLAGDPLADVFMRLLALPVSRFNLPEVIDLVASAPLAEAAGLDADDLERLHGWLRAAGARWGLDAAHRARHGAPAQAAFTWQFALDRLLLGHASGDEAMIDGVAPWTELEGGALDALDRLLRLLRVLAAHERSLAEAMPPAHWRERLQGLLAALLPDAPASPATARALDRLRALIDDFARQAERAGFDAPVPAEAVRAHFDEALRAADTRAPLLTGGVSFARMVPMRLLPFRVICLLGMNDGEFPRRDPAAGLNRLAAEIASGKRIPGDRSTRDDDRYLFLQLFAAAQDAFYLSWIGNDPRDGSVREPSALVTELLAVADACHAPDAEAAKALVVRHALQPFSPQAFGDGVDPRRFSYRGQWRAGAQALAQARAPLPAWLPEASAPEPAGAAEDVVAVDALRRFLRDPAAAFLRHCLGMRLPEIAATGDDRDLLVAPAHVLDKHALQQAMLAGMLANRDPDALQREFSARAMLPAGASGARILAEQRKHLAPYVERQRQWCGDAVANDLAIDLDLGGIRLQGRLAGVYPDGVLRVRVGKHNGPSQIRHGIDWLLASTLGLPLADIHQDKERGVVLAVCAPLPPEQARSALRGLLEIRLAGLRAPLPFAPYSSWEFYNASDPKRGMDAAARRWRGGGNGFAEGSGEAVRQAFRGRDPFADAASRQAFANAAFAVFGLLCEGVSAAAPDMADIVPEDDGEDAE